MPFNFELTISGLCVIVLRSEDEERRPVNPRSVDVLCVGTNGHQHHGQPRHQARLSYLPDEVITDEAVADLVVDPMGGRIAFLDVTGQALALSFGTTPHTAFSVTWGPEDAEAPSSRDEDVWMHWVPTVQDLGFTDGLRLGGPGELVEGVGAVLSLPAGNLFARNVVRDRDSDQPFLWNFPAVGEEERRAIANEVVFRAEGVQDVIFSRNGERYLVSSMSDGFLRMAISNDLPSVNPDFRRGINALDHLSHIAALAPGRPAFQAPRLDTGGRTGHPICNQVLAVI